MRDDELFGNALDLPASEWSAYLDRMCADAAQRARVEALLAGYDGARTFLEKPSGLPERALPAEEKAGDVIGHYTLVKKIGEGGCGVVYLADQAQPVRRRVALKVIKLGMDTRSVIARFEAERQALAMMEHPDIARVFDAGATTTGRPYFVMEYVEGEPITRFCDAHDLSLDARLELFARVCLALQHAHQKGIIHRDVKPSNILVTLRDGVPAPKVIDFGIAKATEARLTDETQLTALDQLVGTPAYMSPEQVERRDLDIDTRSDVYALGVLLYELLTGRPPFDPKSLVRAGVAEIRRIIREVEPPRPSTVLGTLTQADRTIIATRRGAAPAQLSSVLRGDLDWIVMRCLEKDRGRRYATAHAVADDIRRHLRREPVVARPPHALYRAGKFVARNRLACVSAAAVLMAMVAGTIVSVTQAVRARRAERVAVAAREAEQTARTAAQRRQEQAEDLLTFMLGDFRTELAKIGKLPLLDAVGAKAEAYFAALNPEDVSDVALARQAKALYQIGDVRMTQGRYTDAEQAFTRSYERAAALAARHPNDGDLLFERGQAEYWLGFVAWRQGRLEDTRKWWERYFQSGLALVNIDRAKWRGEAAWGYHNLGVLAFEREEPSDALELFQREVALLNELAPDDADPALQFRLIDANSWLGRAKEECGELMAAKSLYARNVAKLEAIVRRWPDNPRWKARLAEAINILSGLQEVTGDPISGRARAVEILEELVASAPENVVWQRQRLFTAVKQADVLQSQGLESEALVLARASRLRLERLLETALRDREVILRISTTSRIEAESGADIAGGLALLDRSRGLLLSFSDRGRLGESVLIELARLHLSKGRLLAKLGNRLGGDQQWKDGYQVVEPKANGGRNWRAMEVAAQLLDALEWTEQATAMKRRLLAAGYVSRDS